jgi:hypothetical protein
MIFQITRPGGFLNYFDAVNHGFVESFPFLLLVIATLVSLVGLGGFAYQVKIFSKQFWRAVSAVLLLLLLYSLYSDVTDINRYWLTQKVVLSPNIVAQTFAMFRISTTDVWLNNKT